MRFRGPRPFRGLKLPELILTSVLGVLVGLYTWTPVIKEYKAYQDKYLEQQKKLQESGDSVAERSPKTEEEVHKVEENWNYSLIGKENCFIQVTIKNQKWSNHTG
jgi:hypothetical protein